MHLRKWRARDHRVIGQDKTARTWDAATGRQIRAFEGHDGFVTSVAFSRDGKRVLTGSRDKSARLWDAVEGNKLRAFKGHESDVMSVPSAPMVRGC